ncbi:MAG TPA: anti-sigma regulatory factor [Candidatus Sulfopaludibacter sp.]|nr:anti-sigma regulatory factor [Candidatus Sulfopaludibacter sp.]
MAVDPDQHLKLNSSEDVVLVRQAVRQMTSVLGFSLVDQTKIVTAASELARNTVTYGGGGSARVELIKAQGRSGVRVTFEDSGPGIANIDQAMKDGFTSGGGLGLGLGGAKRLTDEFGIDSSPGQGTRVWIVRWR